MKKKFTGKCICGHEWDKHHHGCILNPQALKDRKQSFRNVDGCLGEECEATQFEGRHHTKPECYCSTYWDKGWGVPPVYLRKNAR